MSERDLIEIRSQIDSVIDASADQRDQWFADRGVTTDRAKWKARALAAEATIARLSEALAEAEKMGAEARAERDGVLYAFHHRLFSEVGLSYPNDGGSVCTGLKLDALAAAKTLREMGLVTIRNSGAGPLVTWAEGRGLPAPPRDLSQGGQHG